MTIKETLTRATELLKNAGVNSSSLDADVLLAHSLKISKEELLIHSEKKLTAPQVRRFFAFTARRVKREPIAYIVGYKEFYKLDFSVNRSVLIPRPETETLIEEVLKIIDNNLSSSGEVPTCRDETRGSRVDSRFRGNDMVIIDIGTGSGAIAVTLAKLLPRAKVYATDISNKALSIAKQNARRNGVHIIFKKGNLIKPVLPIIKIYSLPSTHYQLIITANLPYVPTQEYKTLQPEITKYEPRAALDGGRDGLKYYKELLAQITKIYSSSERSESRSSLIQNGSRLCSNNIMLFFEFDPEETKVLKKLVLKYFPKARIEIKKDLAKRKRILIAQL